MKDILLTMISNREKQKTMTNEELETDHVSYFFLKNDRNNQVKD